MRYWQALQRRRGARIGKNAAALLTARAGAQVLGLLLAGLLIRQAGAEGWGRYVTVLAVLRIGLLVADLGLNTFTVREFARPAAARSPTLWGTVLGLKVLAALVLIGVLNAAAGLVLSYRPWGRLVALGSMMVLPDTLNGLAAARIKAAQRMEIESLLGFLMSLGILLTGGILLHFGYDEGFVLAAHALVGGLGALAFLSVLRRWEAPVPRCGGLREAGSVLRESAPFAVSNLAAMFYMRADLLILASWHGAGAAGVYGAAYRLWESVGLLPASILDALFPEMSRVSGRERIRKAFGVLYAKARRVLLILAAALVVASAVVAPWITSLLFNVSGSTHPATLLFYLLLASQPFTVLYLLAGHALYALGQQRRVTVVLLGASAINITLNAFLVPRWGYWASAGAMLLTEGALFALLERKRLQMTVEHNTG